jgi:hypothetical protein
LVENSTIGSRRGPLSDKKPTSIRIFLADGTPEGLRLVERSNWTGRALMTSRAQYPEVRGRSEFDRPGVYLLRGPAEGQSFDSRVYIGEADVARHRIDSHMRERDFWTTLILFTSKDANLNKAHVRYLEARLVELARSAKRAEVDNSNNPALPALSEVDIAEADSFLDDMLLIYPVLGVTAFDRVRKAEQGQPRLYLTGAETKAEGRETPEGFVVYQGSLGRVESVPSIRYYKKVIELRESFVGEGLFVVEGRSMRLTQDYLFASPSTAAAVLLGRSANGRIEWKDKAGRTLKELQEAALPAESDGEP